MAIRTGTVRRVWFAIRTAMGIFLPIVGEIFVFFDFYNLTIGGPKMSGNFVRERQRIVYVAARARNFQTFLGRL